MKYLLDTNVIFEARKPRGAERVKRWISSVPVEDLYLSVLTLGEVRRGIGLLEGRDPVQAEVYEAWLTTVLRDYADRIIPVDAETAEEWGRMNVPGPVPVVDSLMAATARVRNMTFVTRNTSDVARTGVRLLNPFESSG
ncbi:PIN domain-containing protein [Rubrobacter tropicus]|uniref:PIN domain-containing protein n=1 Tax=Rubrobacter tropicus TaxID=2653851 RepID=A0A6G8Q4X0_9ACTN|nr:type II toxin-antitoxin system VapC family toxin [Rubrobacter tropicus]QIN81522.1 PIN domain-containing protein [Rubrobacter tropicus]